MQGSPNVAVVNAPTKADLGVVVVVVDVAELDRHESEGDYQGEGVASS